MAGSGNRWPETRAENHPSSHGMSLLLPSSLIIRSTTWKYLVSSSVNDGREGKVELISLPSQNHIGCILSCELYVRKTPQAFYSPEPELKKKKVLAFCLPIDFSPAKDLVSLEHTVFEMPADSHPSPPQPRWSYRSVDLRLCVMIEYFECDQRSESRQFLAQCREID